MKIRETVDLLAGFRVNYPRFGANLTDADQKTLVNLWQTALEPYPAQAVNAIAMQHIAESEFPPTVASILARIKAVRNVDEADANACFESIRRAIRNGFYHAQEEFEKLLPEAQAFVGSPSGLRDLALVDEETIMTVTRGQFFKQFEALRRRAEIKAQIPQSVREALSMPGLIKLMPGASDEEAQ